MGNAEVVGGGDRGGAGAGQAQRSSVGVTAVGRGLGREAGLQLLVGVPGGPCGQQGPATSSQRPAHRCTPCWLPTHQASRPGVPAVHEGLLGRGSLVPEGQRLAPAQGGAGPVPWPGSAPS